jgi:hypothetical protein
MKKFVYVIGFVLFIAVLSMGELQAQEAKPGYNPNSEFPVHESQIMFKKELWWRMDLREKQNQPFYAINGELPTLLVKAVKAGLLFPYMNDSLTNRMSKEMFLENLKLPEEGGGFTEEEKAMGFGADQGASDWGASDWGGGGAAAPAGGGEAAAPAALEFNTRDFSIFELREDWYFDRNRSRMYHDIQALSMFLPADKNPALYEKPIASFRYKDIVDLFATMPDEAVWYNAQNMAEHRKMSDAFLLRLFSATLVKYSNPQDQRIIDVYSKSQKEGVLASQRLEYELVDFENELWEY